MRARIAILASALLVTVLAGCGALASVDDPLAARLNDGELEIAVCTPWQLTTVLVETRATGFVNAQQSVWVAEGRADLAPGDILSSIAPLDGLEATSWTRAQLAPSDELSVTLGGEDDETLEAAFAVPMSGLPTKGWLQSDGTLTEAACG